MYDSRAAKMDKQVFVVDGLVSALVFLVIFWGLDLFKSGTYESVFITHICLFPLIMLLLHSFLTWFGAYATPWSSGNFDYIWAILRASLVSFGVFFAILFLLRIDYVSRKLFIAFAICDFLSLVLIRLAIRNYFLKGLRNGKFALRVLLVGIGERACELADRLQSQAEWGFKIVGFLDPDPAAVGKVVAGSPVIGTVADISDCLKKHVVDEVIIAIPRSLLKDAEPIAQACEEEGIKLRFMADIFELQVARMGLTMVGDIPLLTMEPVAQDDVKLVFKRIFDFSVTLLAMPLVLPIMLAAAIAVKLDSPGPVIFVQERVGLRKHLFPMFKFRSMYIDAEERLKEIEHLNEAEGPIFKISNDPRVTRVGNFIRKTSIDELPQLFNVLRGEMSLVGPRPMSIRDVDLFDRGIQRKRFSVKPGLTCIWQVSGRSDLPFDEWLALDLEYIENWSLSLDLSILLRTVPAVLWSKGAV
ncbi:MAG: sugar transferase [Thermodesulfobacteriota bacterium]